MKTHPFAVSYGAATFPVSAETIAVLALTDERLHECGCIDPAETIATELYRQWCADEEAANDEARRIVAAARMSAYDYYSFLAEGIDPLEVWPCVRY